MIVELRLYGYSSVAGLLSHDGGPLSHDGGLPAVKATTPGVKS